jgi:hypothetical protein
MLKVDRNSQDVEPPKSYLEHQDPISNYLLSEKQREFDGSGDGDDDATEEETELEKVSLSPLSGA